MGISLFWVCTRGPGWVLGLFPHSAHDRVAAASPALTSCSLERPWGFVGSVALPGVASGAGPLSCACWHLLLGRCPLKSFAQL